MQQVIFGIGSNTGDREAMLHAAVKELRTAFGELMLSSVYESPAVLQPGAPAEWNRPFLNMAASCMTADSPVAALALAKSIEQKLGREERGRWAPREIDIDLLAYDGVVLKSRTLTLPHPQLLARAFALLPLAEVAPDWRYPAEGEHSGRPAKELIKRLNMREGAELTRVNLEVA